MRTVRQLLGGKGDLVHTIGPDESVLDALKAMAEHDIGALVVVEDGSVVGLLSERDYARKVILKGRFSKDVRVREIMTSTVVCVGPGQRIDACMSLMTTRRVRHLPVLEAGQLAGLVSIGDVVKAIIEEQQFEIEQLEHYITGSR